MSEVHSAHPRKYLSGHRCGRRLLRGLLTDGHRGRCRCPGLRRVLGRRRRLPRRWRRRCPPGRRLGRAHVAGPVGCRRRGVVGCGGGGRARHALGRRTGRAVATGGSLRHGSVVHVEIVMAFSAGVAAVAATGVVRVRVVAGRVAAIRARAVAVLPLCRRLRLLLWLAPARVRHLVAVAERERVHEVGAHSAS